MDFLSEIVFVYSWCLFIPILMTNLFKFILISDDKFFIFLLISDDKFVIFILIFDDKFLYFYLYLMTNLLYLYLYLMKNSTSVWSMEYKEMNEWGMKRYLSGLDHSVTVSHAVQSAQILQTGRSRVRFPMVSSKLSFRPRYGPGIDSTSNRNEYHEYFLRVKAAGV